MNTIDYARIIADHPETVGTLTAFLMEELPYQWADAYKASIGHPPNLMRITIEGFEYIFDFVQEAVEHGNCPPEKAVEDRVVAVHGRSAARKGERRDHLMRGRPLGPADFISENDRAIYDKGHFIAHSLGGGLEINIFPQLRDTNRGWSERGKIFRAMETYCLQHPGTYYFSHPSYLGKSWHPAAIEYGVLKADGELWVERFENFQDPQEMTEIERLITEPLRAWYHGDGT